MLSICDRKTRTEDRHYGELDSLSPPVDELDASPLSVEPDDWEEEDWEEDSDDDVLSDPVADPDELPEVESVDDPELELVPVCRLCVPVPVPAGAPATGVSKKFGSSRSVPVVEPAWRRCAGCVDDEDDVDELEEDSDELRRSARGGLELLLLDDEEELDDELDDDDSDALRRSARDGLALLLLSDDDSDDADPDDDEPEDDDGCAWRRSPLLDDDEPELLDESDPPDSVEPELPDDPELDGAAVDG